MRIKELLETPTIHEFNLENDDAEDLYSELDYGKSFSVDEFKPKKSEIVVIISTEGGYTGHHDDKFVVRNGKLYFIDDVNEDTVDEVKMSVQQLVAKLQKIEDNYDE